MCVSVCVCECMCAHMHLEPTTYSVCTNLPLPPSPIIQPLPLSLLSSVPLRRVIRRQIEVDCTRFQKRSTKKKLKMKNRVAKEGCQFYRSESQHWGEGTLRGLTPFLLGDESGSYGHCPPSSNVSGSNVRTNPHEQL